MARLVDENEEGEAEDGDGEAHATGTSTARRARRASASASTSSSRSRAGAPSTAIERALDDLGDPEERQPAVEERGDGDLVGGVVGARVGAAALARLAREREHRERLLVRLLELEREPAARSSGAIGVAARSGYVSAYEIGTRMSG